MEIILILTNTLTALIIGSLAYSYGKKFGVRDLIKRLKDKGMFYTNNSFDGQGEPRSGG